MAGQDRYGHVRRYGQIRLGEEIRPRADLRGDGRDGLRRTRGRWVSGLTQRQLAARMTALGRPITNLVLSRTERARRRCDVDDLVAIATALGISPMTLLEPLSPEPGSVTAAANTVRRDG